MAVELNLFPNPLPRGQKAGCGETQIELTSKTNALTLLIAMKNYWGIFLLCVGCGIGFTSFADDTNAVAAPVVSEEARKHFVMGETMFKEAKSPDGFSQAAGEFSEAARLAPQWPEARYNLALTKEAAGDLSGAMADLKLYQQFKLSDAEARTVQDKIYAVEAKQKMKQADETNTAQNKIDATKRDLNGVKWRYDFKDNSGDGYREIECSGTTLNESVYFTHSQLPRELQGNGLRWKAVLNGRKFASADEYRSGDGQGVISEDAKTITITWPYLQGWGNITPRIYTRE